MEALLPIIMQLVGGGAGGLGAGGLLKNVNLGPLGNIITGAVGGVGGTFIAGFIPGLSGLLGTTAETAGAPADAAATSTDGAGAATDAAGAATDAVGAVTDAAGAVAASGIDFGMLATQGVTGLAGGGILTIVVGLIKNAMAK